MSGRAGAVSGPGRQTEATGALGRAAVASLPATVALGTLTVVAAAGMGRLFQGQAWIVPVMSSAVAAHGLGWATRRARLTGWVAIPLVAVAIFLVLVWTVLPDSTFYGLPTENTLATLTRELSAAKHAFAIVVAPAPTLPGLVLWAGAGAGTVAVLSDWAAFRLGAVLEAVVPALATLVFVSLLATGTDHTLWAAGLVVVMGIYVAISEATRRSAHPSRFTGGSGRRGLLTLGGAAMIALAAAGGLVIGPRLPGARAAPVVSVHHQSASGPSQRTTISPLVDIRSRLIQQSDTELFTVQSRTASYWRLTSLDHFDGNIWSSDAPYATVGENLPTSPAPSASVSIRQSYDILNLGSIWLPAAYLPTQVRGAPGVSWDAQSASLISRAPTSDGERYLLTSVQPRFTAAELRTAEPSKADPSVVQQNLALPASVPADVVALARRVTAGARTPFDQALDLQNFLRDHYTYSLAVQPGHSNSAIEDFLFQSRKGYCEQFAGSYAVMARAIGLPARVAVGFTPGQLQANGTWKVLGLDAHAWPEVLLGQFGWVAFDPTPGRGIPGATEYTGIAPEEATLGSQSAGTPTTQAVPTPSGRGATPPKLQKLLLQGGGPKTKAGVAARSARSRYESFALLAGLAALSILWGLGIPLTKRNRRLRRRREATKAADQVLVAWEEVNDGLRQVGCPRRPGETLLEHARRATLAAHLSPEAAASLRDLATRAGASAYGPPQDSETEVRAARARAGEVERALLEGVPTWRRLGREMDPRSLSRS